MRKPVLISLLLLVSFSFSHAQINKKLKQINASSSDSVRAVLYDDIAGIYADRRQPDSVLYYSDKALELANKLKNRYLYFRTLESKGVYLRKQGRNLESLEALKKAHDFYHKNNHTTDNGRTFNEIAINHYFLGQPEKALENYQKSLRIFTSLNDTFQIANCLNNIGIIHYQQQDLEKALDYYLKALKKYKQLDKKFSIAQTQNNIAAIYMKQENFEKAEPFLLNAIEICEEIEYYFALPALYINMGGLVKNRMEYYKAEEYYKKALEVSERLGNPHSIAEAKSVMGYLYINMADSMIMPHSIRMDYLNNAAELNLEAYRISTKHNFLEQRLESAEYLMYAYERLNDYEKALKYSQIFKEASDSLRNQKRDKTLAEMEEKYQNEQKQLQIEQLKKEQLLKDKNIRNQRLIMFILIVSSISIGIFLLIVILQNRQKRKTNKLLEKKNKEINQAYNELEKMSVALANSDNAIVVADANGRIEWINKGFLDHFDNTINLEKDIKGKTLAETSQKQDFNNLLEDIKRTGKSVSYESEFRNPDGQHINTQATITPIFENGRINRFVLVETNISQLKATEQKLKETMDTKDKFLSIIAHDLKNPFVSLLGLSEVYVEDHDNLTEEEIHEFIINVYKVSKQGYDLLENLLEWSRLQSGKIRLDRVDVNLPEPVLKTEELLRLNAEQKGVQLHNMVNDPVKVKADEYALLTILRNLASNAIKYTQSGGEVNIYYREEGEIIKIFVKDNGVGMEENIIEQVLNNNLQQSQPGTSNEKGIGLGLHLVQEFVNAQGGSLSIQSNKGEGTTVSFTVEKA